MGDPAAIAEQFLVAAAGYGPETGAKSFGIRAGFLHILWDPGSCLVCCVIVLGAFALAVFALRGCLVSAPTRRPDPSIALVRALLFDFSFFSLGILSTIGALQLYCTRPMDTRLRTLARNVMGDGRNPPAVHNPACGRRFSRFLRTTTVVHWWCSCFSASRRSHSPPCRFQPFWHAAGLVRLTG